MAISRFNGIFTNIRTSRTPSLRYTSHGVPVLEVNCLADKWISGKGRDRVTETVRLRFTVWRDKADYLNSLMQQHDNPKGPGVGLLLNAYVTDDMPTARGWVRLDADKQPVYDEKGKPVVDCELQFTARDIDILTPLPEGAYQKAHGAPAGGTPRRDEEPVDIYDTSDIPF